MGVYVLWEISRRNYDSAQGALPLGRYHNSWGIFLIARTCPYINEFITRGNRKINVDRDADGLFSSTLPLTRSELYVWVFLLVRHYKRQEASKLANVKTTYTQLL